MPEIICALVPKSSKMLCNQQIFQATRLALVTANPSEGGGILASKLSRYAVGEPRISREDASVDSSQARTGDPVPLGYKPYTSEFSPANSRSPLEGTAQAIQGAT